jgi:hypothetical protein
VFGDDVAFTLEPGEEVVGADAATFWQGYFGKETGRADHRCLPRVRRTHVLSGRVRAYAVEVEMSGGHIASMTERQPET